MSQSTNWRLVKWVKHPKKISEMSQNLPEVFVPLTQCKSIFGYKHCFSVKRLDVRKQQEKHLHFNILGLSIQVFFFNAWCLETNRYQFYIFSYNEVLERLRAFTFIIPTKPDVILTLLSCSSRHDVWKLLQKELKNMCLRALDTDVFFSCMMFGNQHMPVLYIFLPWTFGKVACFYIYCSHLVWCNYLHFFPV